MLKDEMVLNVDGVLRVDPALGLHQRAQAFVASRQWTTPSVFYGDQLEVEQQEQARKWSMNFCLGLDHIPKSNKDWFADVVAIVEFLQPVARETGCEFTIEFRLKSRLWYSETVGFIGPEPTDKTDLPAVRAMLEQLIGQRRWWTVPDSTFRHMWPQERKRGRLRFVLNRGVLPWGLILGLVWSALAGGERTGSLLQPRIVLWFVAGLTFGAGVGAWRWARAESRYKKLSAQHGPVA